MISLNTRSDHEVDENPYDFKGVRHRMAIRCRASSPPVRILSAWLRHGQGEGAWHPLTTRAMVPDSDGRTSERAPST